MPQKIRLMDAVREWEAHSRARRLAENSIKNRIQPLNQAFDVWGNIYVCNIEPRHIDVLFSRHSWAESTTNQYLATLRQFFTWARAHNYLGKDDDPTAGWYNLRVPVREKMRIPVDMFPTLLDAAPHPVDRMVVALGLFTFMRGSEISTLRVSDLENLDSKFPLLHIVRHKTKEEDALPVVRELQFEIKRFFRYYTSKAGILQPHWYLVPRPKSLLGNANVKREGVDPGVDPLRPYTHPYRAVQRAWGALGNETKGIGVHDLRRSGARAYADTLRSEGHDGALLRVASILGHKDVKQTQKYIGWGLERKQRNDMLAGKFMFPQLQGDAVVLEVPQERVLGE
jgi:integrase